MKVYHGKRRKDVLTVTVDGHQLDARTDLWDHSPSGFEWGYSGSGPAQLALALLAYHLQDDKEAVVLHQAFKFAVIAKLPRNDWTLTSAQIHEAVQTLQGSVSSEIYCTEPELTGGGWDE